MVGSIPPLFRRGGKGEIALKYFPLPPQGEGQGEGVHLLQWTGTRPASTTFPDMIRRTKKWGLFRPPLSVSFKSLKLSAVS